MLVLLGLVGCSAGQRSGDGLGGDPAITQIPIAGRVSVDDFQGQLLDGSDVDASQLDGVVTVVNVWGSWCGPCRAEAPALRQVSLEYADQGVKFLGLNVRDNDAAAIAFEQKFKISYPSITSADSPRVSLAFAGLLTTAAVPMTVVVDRERRVAARVVGRTTAATLRALLDSVLAETSAGDGQ